MDEKVTACHVPCLSPADSNVYCIASPSRQQVPVLQCMNCFGWRLTAANSQQYLFALGLPRTLSIHWAGMWYVDGDACPQRSRSRRGDWSGPERSPCHNHMAEAQSGEQAGMSAYMAYCSHCFHPDTWHSKGAWHIKASAGLPFCVSRQCKSTKVHGSMIVTHICRWPPTPRAQARCCSRR